MSEKDSLETKIAVLKEKQDHIKEDVTEIKNILKAIQSMISGDDIKILLINIQESIKSIQNHIEPENHKKIVIEQWLLEFDKEEFKTKILNDLISTQRYKDVKKEENIQYWKNIEGNISKKILRWMLATITTIAIGIVVVWSNIGK